MKKLIFSILTIILISGISCKNQTENQDQKDFIDNSSIHNDIERIEPPNWWVGFKSNTLQLLVHHPGISHFRPSISYQGIKISETHKGKSPNYLFIDLEISDIADAGKFNVSFQNDNGVELKQTYELKTRQLSSEEYEGFDSSDVIYLITPDRFVNANPSNDIVNSLKENTINRSDDYGRHGGDIEGITQHLDYIDGMGFTAIWPCPLLTNDMYRSSYHGYAITDYYEIDPRFGTLDDYLQLSKEANEKGIKLIMDQVANHCGSQHWWMNDLPFDDWINFQKDYESLPKPAEEMKKEDGSFDWELMKQYFTNSNHKRTTNQDIYASEYDSQLMTDGWFVPFMPDLNQRNRFMATYLIQNSIWWIETANLGGIRQDTYPYPDKEFMSQWAGAIMEEYPNFTIVGEEWSYNPLLIGYWQDGANNKDGYDSNLKSSMDFAMQKAIVDALNEEESWNKGFVKIYEGLANDFHYASPKDIMIFPDNHDMSRIFTQLKGDITNTKMALGYLLSLPRIPQLYYGTEILMADFEKPGDHGLVRSDFPGGWEGDAVNAFTGEGLSEEQRDMQEFLKTLLNFRKGSTAIHEGKTIHFGPSDGVYVLCRVGSDETVVVILNKNTSEFHLELGRFDELGLSGKMLKNIISKEEIKWEGTFTLASKGITILTTKR